jgi:preprotein translocase subunit SecA
MTQDTILQMRISEEIRAMLDEIRRAEEDIPTRSEMVRRLIMEAYKKVERRK